MSDGQNYFYQTFMVLFCVLPVTSSMFVSGYLFRLTRQKRHAPVNIGENLDTPTFKNKVFFIKLLNENLLITEY